MDSDCLLGGRGRLGVGCAAVTSDGVARYRRRGPELAIDDIPAAVGDRCREIRSRLYTLNAATSDNCCAFGSQREPEVA